MRQEQQSQTEEHEAGPNIVNDRQIKNFRRLILLTNKTEKNRKSDALEEL